MESPLDDNPPALDTRSEIAEFVKDRGHDPFDLGKDEQVLEGNAIAHAWADEDPDDRGGRSATTLALEHERLLDRAQERGLDVTRPEIESEQELPDWLEGY